MNVVRRRDYKVFNNGTYLGLLPYVTSEFEYTQEINTPATDIEIVVGYHLDTANEAPEPIETEQGLPITTEQGMPITMERSLEVIGEAGSERLIANNNDVEVWEYSDYHPNGIKVFSGYISRWSSRLGAETAETVVTVVSHGIDLEDYIIGNEDIALQISQTNEGTGSGVGYWDTRRYGQTFTTTGGQTDIIKIILKISSSVSGAPYTITLRVWNNPTEAIIGGTPLGTASVTFANNFLPPIEKEFVFASPITVSPSTQYFFSVETNAPFADVSGFIANDSSDSYAGGAMFKSSGGGAWNLTTPVEGYDFYFKVYSGTILTDAVFTNEDPSDMLRDSLDIYQAQGGVVSYDGSIDNTGLNLSYTWKLATMHEIVRKVRELAPSGWYWYVDIAEQVLYLKETLTTSVHQFILGRHMEEVEIESSIEQVINVIYFSGGPTLGVNLLKLYTNEESLASYRRRMKRVSDNRVIIDATAEAISDSLMDENGSEQYLVQLEIVAETYDITTINLGETVSMTGFANWLDLTILQIVKIRRRADSVVIYLGQLPIRDDEYVEDMKRDIIKQQTLDNPDEPS